MKRYSFAFLFAAEIFASVVGFGVMITLARRLGPSSFADFEYGTAVAAWWLVIVRGGFDAIVYREAARKPRLIGRLTDLLIGLRLASVVVALLAILTLARASQPARFWSVAVAGLILIPSALATDVGPRARSHFGFLALVQVIRITCLAVGVGLLVAGSTDVLTAMGCLIGSETASTLSLLIMHISSHDAVSPRFRWRAMRVFAARGGIAGATRFCRVSLYAVDLLLLANLAPTSELGPFAAARRVAFALLALGLVVPSALGPRLAVEWTRGVVQARSSLAIACQRMFAIALPATVGLVGTADRWMLAFFGEAFREGGPWLALIAARLPFVLASNLQQTALIACRREAWALRLILGMMITGMIILPLLAVRYGTLGVVWGILFLEAGGAVAGWLALRRLEIATRWHHSNIPTLVGCLGLILICSIGHQWPLWLVVLTGVAVHGGVICLVAVGLRSRESRFFSRIVPILPGGSS